MLKEPTDGAPQVDTPKPSSHSSDLRRLLQAQEKGLKGQRLVEAMRWMDKTWPGKGWGAEAVEHEKFLARRKLKGL